MNENQTVTYTTGDKVKINYPDSRLNGKIATYKYPSGEGISHLVLTEDGEETWVQTRFLAPHTDEQINRYTPPPSYEVLRSSHDDLMRQVAVLQAKVETLSTQVENGHKAVEIIGNRLISESDDRGWCDEFDRIVDEVNELLPGSFQLPTREREYEVEWTEYVTVQVSCSTTVRARNEADAIDMARNEFDGVHTTDVVDAVRYGNWEVDEYADHDFCASEV